MMAAIFGFEFCCINGAWLYPPKNWPASGHTSWPPRLLAPFMPIWKGSIEEENGTRHTLSHCRCCFIYFLTYRKTFFTLRTFYSSFHGPIAAPSTLEVLYSPRDYRSEGASASEWKEVTVRSSTEVLFQPEGTNKVRKFKFSSIVSVQLSA